MKMYNLIFIAKYPKNNSLEGMRQRIINIDNLFCDYKRAYIDISISKYFKMEIETSDGVDVYKVNFLKFFTLVKLINRSNKLYVHSIYYFSLILFPYFFSNKKLKSITLDLHGAVPEELNFNKRYILSHIFSLIERIAFKKVDKFVFVTEAMRKHFFNKYKSNQMKSLVYSIFTSNVCKGYDVSDIKSLKNKLNIFDDDVVFIYAGNAQKWQNIDLMLMFFSQIANNNYKLLILTNDIKILKEKIKYYKLDDRVHVDSVKPEVLGLYYAISHYGFILRDQHILNKVANPTKLIEYLYYGIIPIVKYIDIGDFISLGYEYRSINDMLTVFTNVKSSKNINIANEVFKHNQECNLDTFVFNT